MSLNQEQIVRIKRMNRDELIGTVQSEDLAVLMVAILRLQRTARWLNIVLMVLTVIIIYAALKLGHA